MSRYVVTEVEGWEIRPVIREQGPLPGLSVHVLDTAWNHRIVATYRSERVPGIQNLTRGEKRAVIRERAERLAALLTALDEVALGAKSV
jgi:hypothetical protein